MIRLLKPNLLRKKLIFAFRLVALIPLIIAGVYGIYISVYTIENNQLQSLNQELFLRKNKVERDLMQAREDIGFLSNLPSVKRLLTNSNDDKELFLKEVEEEFLGFAEAKSSYYQIRFIDARGAEVVRVESIQGKPQISRKRLQSKADREYFLKALQLPKGGIYVSPLELNQEFGKIEKPFVPVIRYAIPVFDDRDQVKGVVVTNLFADKLLGIEDLASTKEEATWFLTDKEGNYKFHPREDKRWGGIPELNRYSNVKDDFPEWSEKMLSGFRGSFSSWSQGVMVFDLIHPDPQGRDYWVLGIQQPLIRIDVFAGFVLFSVILLGALSLFLAQILSKYLVREVTTPIKELNEGVKIFARGDLNHRITIDSGDEIEDLARNFNLMAQELQHLYNNLENEVKKRTHELRESNTKLELAYKAKSQFLANMSHELRTPLHSIIGFSEVLEEELGGPLSEEQRRYVNNILISGQQLLALINEILDLAKMEAKKMTLKLEPLDPNRLVSEAVDIIGPLAQKKSIQMTKSVADTSSDLVADRQRLSQILLNLLSNAIKFTPEMGAVELELVEGDQDWTFFVRDNGMGIPEDLKDHIFEEFVQGDDSLNKTFKGTGLGLALVRELVHLHGGQIGLESEVNQGSVFFFTIPKSLSKGLLSK